LFLLRDGRRADPPLLSPFPSEGPLFSLCTAPPRELCSPPYFLRQACPCTQSFWWPDDGHKIGSDVLLSSTPSPHKFFRAVFFFMLPRGCFASRLTTSVVKVQPARITIFPFSWSVLGLKLQSPICAFSCQFRRRHTNRWHDSPFGVYVPSSVPPAISITYSWT